MSLEYDKNLIISNALNRMKFFINVNPNLATELPDFYNDIVKAIKLLNEKEDFSEYENDVDDRLLHINLTGLVINDEKYVSLKQLDQSLIEVESELIAGNSKLSASKFIEGFRMVLENANKIGNDYEGEL